MLLLYPTSLIRYAKTTHIKFNLKLELKNSRVESFQISSRLILTTMTKYSW
jgi:hypothetical protein